VTNNSLCEQLARYRYCYCMQADFPATIPRVSKLEFQFLPELGDYKTINGERYLNPWINYTLPNPILVGFTVSLSETCVFAASFRAVSQPGNPGSILGFSFFSFFTFMYIVYFREDSMLSSAKAIIRFCAMRSSEITERLYKFLRGFCKPQKSVWVNLLKFCDIH